MTERVAASRRAIALAFMVSLSLSFGPQVVADDLHAHYLVLPPYWFFLSSSGRAIVDETLKPRHVIGVHVPKTIPDAPEERPIEFDGFDLFTAPGEERVLKAADPE